ncbi:Mediator of RNA polymerase II transcription subunit 25, partial [Armadillidium nasatum]
MNLKENATYCLGVQYAVVFFGSELSVMGGCTQIETEGPTSSHSSVLKMIKEANYPNGMISRQLYSSYSYRNTCRQAYIHEAMETAIEVFKYLSEGDIYCDNVDRCIVIVTQSSPIENLFATSSPENILTELKKVGVKTSIISAHKMVELYKLFEGAGGDLQSITAVNYAVQSQHLVLLNGLVLNEPGMNPCLNKKSIETDVQPVPATLTPNAALPNISHSSCDNSLPNSRIHSSHVQMITPPTSNNPPPHTFTPIISDRPTQPTVNESSNENIQSTISTQKVSFTQNIIWEGILEFQDKVNSSVTNSGLLNRIPCKVIPVVNFKALINTKGWSNTIHLVFLPKTLLQSVPNSYFQNPLRVFFNLEAGPSLKNLSSILSKSHGACGHFRDNNEMKMLLLVYSVDKDAFVGFIPQDQTGFVALMKQIISSQPRNLQQSSNVEQKKERETDSDLSLVKKRAYQPTPSERQQLQEQQQCQQQQQHQEQRLQLLQQQQHFVLLQQHQQSQNMETMRNINSNQNQSLPSISLITPQTCLPGIQPPKVMGNSLNIDWRRVRQINIGGQRVSYHSDQ